MKNVQLTAQILGGLLVTLAGAHAQEGPVTLLECPKTYELAVVNVDVGLVTQAENCPLLQDEALRELTALHFHGATFAGLPGTCVSGSIFPGSTIAVGGEEIPVTGTTESAQRLMPEAAALNSSSPLPPLDPLSSLFIQGLKIDENAEPVFPFISGAAATIVTLASEDKKLDGLRLVIEDRFSVNLLSGEDTEDFSVIGADRASVTGRLTGVGTTNGVSGLLSLQGSFCIKYVVPTLK